MSLFLEVGDSNRGHLETLKKNLIYSLISIKSDLYGSSKSTCRDPVVAVPVGSLSAIHNMNYTELRLAFVLLTTGGVYRSGDGGSQFDYKTSRVCLCVCV